MNKLYFASLLSPLHHRPLFYKTKLTNTTIVHSEKLGKIPTVMHHSRTDIYAHY